MHRVQAALPREALEAGWDDGAWRAQVAYAGSIAELRLLLGRLEEAILDGWLSPHFQRSPLLVKGAWLPTGGWLLAETLHQRAPPIESQAFQCL